MVKFKSIFFVILCSLTLHCYGQQPSTFTLKYFGMTIHPFGDKTAHLQPYKLDKKARFIINFGGFAGYERFIYKDLVSLKVIQGVFTDCSAGLAGITHLGIRARMYETGKHRFYFGIGPTYLYRKSWTRFGDDYTSSGYFNETRIGKHDIQHRVIPYGCEIEWDFSMNEKNALSVSFTPGAPMAMTFAFGWKHWFTHCEFDYNQLYVPRKKRRK